MTMRRFSDALAAALLCACAAAQAHSFHVAITDIAFNARSGSTEIVHTYMAHDVEALLSNLYQRQFDLTQPEDEAIFRNYVEKKFYLQARDKSRLPLHWVGLTIDADNVVVYQEIEHTPVSKAALIHDEVLIDFLPEQANTVNLNTGGAIHTLAFDRSHVDQPAP